jgi:hypothetical protein
MAPTPAMLADYAAACRDFATAVASWNAIRRRGLARLNAPLAKHDLATVPATGRVLGVPSCGGTGGTASRGARR